MLFEYRKDYLKVVRYFVDFDIDFYYKKKKDLNSIINIFYYTPKFIMDKCSGLPGLVLFLKKTSKKNEKVKYILKRYSNYLEDYEKFIKKPELYIDPTKVYVFDCCYAAFYVDGDHDKHFTPILKNVEKVLEKKDQLSPLHFYLLTGVVKWSISIHLERHNITLCKENQDIFDKVKAVFNK